MSLHIGNISSRIRRDELERVFQRFGRCSVRLKDGYGFVVYEFPPHAEKALRALRRSYICGEQLTLSWSNKQPRAFKGSARSEGSYEARHGRDTRREEDIVGRNLADSSDYGDSRMNIIKQPDSNVGRIGSANMLDEEIAYHQDGTKDFIREGHDYREDALEGHMGVRNPVDDDRWGHQFHDPMDGNGVDNGLEFDRYEPNKVYDEKIDDYSRQMTYTGGSALGSSHNIGRAHIGEGTSKHPNDAKRRGNCYRCGGSGHKMRNCPQKNASRRNLTSFDHRHDIDRRGRDKEELERFRSRSREGLRSRDANLNMQLLNDMKPGSGGRSMIGGSYQVSQETDKSVRQDYVGKKRNKKEIGSPKRLNTKKARRSVSSSLSDYTPSKLQSTLPSSKQVPRSSSHSRLRSLSSRGNSGSFHSRSTSKSPNSRSRSIRSKSRSRSSSPTSLSLSVSLGRPLPSSSNKAQLIPKGSVDNTPESKDILIEPEQTARVDTQLEDTKLEGGLLAVNNNTAVSISRMESEIEKDEPLNKNSCVRQITSRALNEGTDPSTQLADKAIATESSYKEVLNETGECPDSEAADVAYSRHTASLTSDELFMVLKHYGFELQEEHKNHTAEAYFGSARLWPWEIIYYRRLKKGPITVENYARRIEQNREFGIIDKYVRSSSGWGELSQGNP
ncbi:hypothetical protein K2173_010620 [Erythroxylum novogranatense]|uniref:Uncharacterized protein n=1 Tax=Erythroxylum novogranatense TaxID=1862640 RepID=A0AAV8UCD8_9ROSI|nr:hypothetical protein K2173_010620 [Erythroxylum novogranatense]